MYPDEDYELFCELNPCPRCDGSGETIDGNGEDETCGLCSGSGQDPDAVFDEA